MGKKKIVLCDTNILIELFHGNELICQELDLLTFERLAIPVITAAEIYFGMRKNEKSNTKNLLRRFNILHIDKETSKVFIELMLSYHDKKIAVPDALIAAIAIRNQMELYTLNKKDFDFIEELVLYKPGKLSTKI